MGGGDILSTFMKHVNQHKGKVLNVERTVGKQLLRETKNHLRKPKNQRLLKTVTDHLIDEVANKLDRAAPQKIKSVNSSLQNKLSIMKKEAKKIAKKKSKDFINIFTKYVN